MIQHNREATIKRNNETPPLPIQNAGPPRERSVTTYMKNLKLKIARMEKDISQTELAKQVGVTRQTIGMVESGDYNPTLNLCIQICKSLGKTLNDLFWEEEDE